MIVNCRTVVIQAGYMAEAKAFLPTGTSKRNRLT